MGTSTTWRDERAGALPLRFRLREASARRREARQVRAEGRTNLPTLPADLQRELREVDGLLRERTLITSVEWKDFELEHSEARGSLTVSYGEKLRLQLTPAVGSTVWDLMLHCPCFAEVGARALAGQRLYDEEACPFGGEHVLNHSFFSGFNAREVQRETVEECAALLERELTAVVGPLTAALERFPTEEWLAEFFSTLTPMRW